MFATIVVLALARPAIRAAARRILKKGIAMGTETTINLNQLIEQAQTTGTITYQDAVISLAAILVILGIIAFLQLFVIIGRWKTIKKLGGHGWSQVIPIYSEWCLSRAAGCVTKLCVAITVLDAISIFSGAFDASWWSTLTGICGIALIVVRCLVIDKVCKRFGKKGVGFQIGLFFLPCIFYMILGCGSAQPVDEE